MERLHPIFSGFPAAFLALIIIGELLHFTPLRSNAAQIVRIGVIGLCLAMASAFFSGYQASSGLDELPDDVNSILSSHHAWGRMGLIVSLLLVLFLEVSHRATRGKAVFIGLYYLLLAIQICLVVYVGSLGGSLVFDSGVGVKINGRVLFLPNIPNHPHSLRSP